MTEGTTISPALIRRKIEEAEARKAAALREYEAAEAELGWWREGLRVFGDGAEPQPGPKITELFPSAKFLREAPGFRPTLRQAIIAVMAEASATHWRVSDLAAALARERWLPERDDAHKRVSDMAGAMASEGQLYRVARGVYALDPQLAATLALGHARKA